MRCATSLLGHTSIQKRLSEKKKEQHKYFYAYGKMHSRHKLNDIIRLTNKTTKTRCATENTGKCDVRMRLKREKQHTCTREEKNPKRRKVKRD